MTTPDETDATLFSVDHLIFMVFRRKWLLILGLLLGLGAAAATHVLTPVFYVSEAKLLVRYVSDSTAMDPSAEEGKVMRPGNRSDSIMNSEVQILNTRILAERVVAEIGAAALFPPAEPGQSPMSDGEAAVAMLKSLTIDVPHNSNILQLSFAAHAPEIARQVLDNLIGQYLQKHQEIHSAAASYEFFSQKTDQLRSELRATEKELQQLKSDQEVLSLEDAMQRLIVRRDEIRKGIGDHQGQIAAGSARVKLLQERIGETVSLAEGSESKTAADPQERLRRQQSHRQLELLRKRELSLLSEFTPESVPVQSIQLQIQAAERQLAQAAGPAGTIRDPLISSDDLRLELIMEQSRIASARALLQVLETQLQATQDRVADLSANESRLTELERQREIQDGAYRRFSGALDTARNQLTLSPEQLVNITEIQPATLPLQPSKPANARKRVLMAGAAGLGLFGGLALLLELLGQRSFRNPLDIEQFLHVPTLISFPRDPIFRRPFALTSTVPRLAAGDEGTAAEPEPTRALADPIQGYYDALWHRIEMTGVLNGEIPHMIGIASCVEGSGTTTVAGGLALCRSANEGEKVLLIDGNLGSDHTYQVMGVNGAASLPELLLDGTAETSRVQQGLYMLSAGNGEHKMIRSSLGRRFRDLVDYLKDSQFTTVVLDLPPVTETSPALQMAGLLDGVILVVESERVSRERAQAAVKMLRDANANVMGVVFNKKRDYVPGWLDSAV